MPRALRIVGGRPAALEDDEQAAIIEWARSVRIVVGRQSVPLTDHLYAVPNGQVFAFRGTERQRMARWRRLLRIGFAPGCLDLNLDIARGPWHGLRLELKAQGGRVTPEQHDWIRRHRAAGYWSGVAVGATQGIEMIRDYLRTGAPDSV